MRVSLGNNSWALRGHERMWTYVMKRAEKPHTNDDRQAGKRKAFKMTHETKTLTGRRHDRELRPRPFNPAKSSDAEEEDLRQLLGAVVWAEKSDATTKKRHAQTNTHRQNSVGGTAIRAKVSLLRLCS